jgi:hypothetical protein
MTFHKTTLAIDVRRTLSTSHQTVIPAQAGTQLSPLPLTLHRSKAKATATAGPRPSPG